MTKNQFFQADFLSWVARFFGSAHQYAFVMVSKLAIKYDIPIDHVQELLMRWESEHLISLAAWDGERSKPMREWDDVQDFFYNRTDSGSIRIRLLADGADFVERYMQSRNETQETNPKVGFLS